MLTVAIVPVSSLHLYSHFNTMAQPGSRRPVPEVSFFFNTVTLFLLEYLNVHVCSADAHIVQFVWLGEGRCIMNELLCQCVTFEC